MVVSIDNCSYLSCSSTSFPISSGNPWRISFRRFSWFCWWRRISSRYDLTVSRSIGCWWTWVSQPPLISFYIALPIAVILGVFLVCRLKRYSYACSVNSCSRSLLLQPTDCPNCRRVLQTSRSVDLLVCVERIFHSHDLSRSLQIVAFCPHCLLTKYYLYCFINSFM